MLRKFFATGIAMATLQTTSAQDSISSSKLSVGGVADIYYRSSFSGSKPGSLTSFTNSHNRFELGMASLKLQYKTSKVEWVADLGFGKRAQEFSYNDAGAMAAIKQLYIGYALSDWLKLTAGSWATHIGYELVDPHLNRNYSMSYMFSNGPFFHTGLKAEVTAGSSSFMVGLANPTDFKYVPEGFINRKFLLAQYAFAPGDQLKAYINYAGGKNIDTTSSHQFDLVVTSKLSEQFSLGFNGTVNRTKTYLGDKHYDRSRSWWGSALYINFDPSDKWGLSLREEYFNDENQLKIYKQLNSGGGVFASTVSANLKTDHFILIPEFRIDHASESLFPGRNGVFKKTTANFLIAAIYHF